MSETPDNRPRVTVDVVLFTLMGTLDNGRPRQCVQVVLSRRDHPPFAGSWALPGSLVGREESLEQAAQRVLQEVVGATGIYLEQLYTFGEPGRDPRGRVITVAYYALVPSDRVRRVARESDADAEALAWFPADTLPAEMAFDHGRIVEYALWRLRNKIEYTDIAFQFLPEQFSLTRLRQVYEAVRGEPLDKRNFNRKVLGSGLVVETGAVQGGQAHRPARLYSFVRQQSSQPPQP